jgi:hypothetical protein
MKYRIRHVPNEPNKRIVFLIDMSVCEVTKLNDNQWHPYDDVTDYGAGTISGAADLYAKACSEVDSRSDFYKILTELNFYKD